ncbi:hypothetical protein D1BOALGB6SA_3705 [Olavius sp. associated proteobacterium Delta 1]|nr:hypothetical protein D1BOALGB6SA_3705 [Olavius sp. associated proteobacterium Delta 1]
MTRRIYKNSAVFWTATALLFQALVLPAPVAAQEEVASSLRRYKDREVSTGYYEEYEVLPSRQRPLISVPGLRRGTFPYSPTAARVRIRTRLADSHQGIKFYSVLRCEYCHVDQTRDIHTVRANLTCRQCHGGEPIAGIQHAFSAMNPIRRHAYVCARCHEGASVSFASYIVHEPAAGSLTAKKDFPILYYSYWFIFLLLVGTLAFFIPHTFLVGVRELIAKVMPVERDGKRHAEGDGEPDAKPADIERSDEHDDRRDDERDDNQDDDVKRDDPKDG